MLSKAERSKLMEKTLTQKQARELREAERTVKIKPKNKKISNGMNKYWAAKKAAVKKAKAIIADLEKSEYYTKALKEENTKASTPVKSGIYAAGPSGALSSSKRIRYDLLPRVLVERVTKRFELGAVKYPPFNYKQGLEDKEYIIERINHLVEHVLDFISPVSDEQWDDDNLAGIGWAVAFLMECETTEKGREAIKEIRLERSARCRLEMEK